VIRATPAARTAGLERNLGHHLDLAAAVHEERSVGSVHDVDPVDEANRSDDAIELRRCR
jgi:hypothetical protein